MKEEIAQLDRHNCIEDCILELFSSSDRALSIEREIDAIAEEFLRRDRISTNLDLGSIVEQFRESQISAETSDLSSYLKDLTENVVLHSINTYSPRYIGHMTSALPYFVRPLGKLMTALNQNVVKMETSKSFSLLERQVLGTIHRSIYDFAEDFYQTHIQKNESTLGVLTTGGTLANLTALWCARNFVLGSKEGFTGIENEGLTAAFNAYGCEGAAIIGSQLMHYSFDKAAGLLGIGEKSLIKLPVDRDRRLNLSALRQAIQTCRDRGQRIIALVGIAGTTDCGAIDPLLEMAEIAQEANIHFHVDAAWGGPVIFSPQHREKLAGIEMADSVTIDGHKQLYLPMGIGMVLFRNPYLAKNIEKCAPYTIRKDSIDLGKRALEGSRPGMVLFLQAALKIIGKKGYEFLIDEGIRKARYMADCIRKQAEFELLVAPEINILLYRYIPQPWRQKVAAGQITELDNQKLDRFNECLQSLQLQTGRTFVSRTTIEIDGRPTIALRAVLANPLTTESDIDAVLEDQLKIAAQIPTNDEEVCR
ncbi:glutamate decarboxylase [Hydrococcus rivularis NIES-593]|uniref:Glutamate decarboxylase n=1 Tax=Hydrococcus rivularis NIES-593 TaxID=1921803 RepID=A0A1U7HBE8_9CYAN|nr:aminotransferase class V-fold PLP-dependent enzyme [Hydrococcus rivularis]OKH20884.1 glutamate decarboxylase [Hydrococcus rivularis NIES-593]